MSIATFIKQITYLSFSDVISWCQVNRQYNDYCTNPKYKIYWRSLIDETFKNYIYDYVSKLEKIWSHPDYIYPRNSYNYIVYTKLVNLLDPISQLMIYYKQRDIVSSSDSKFNDTQRFLAYFLLGKKDIIKDYLPSKSYQPFIDFLDGEKISSENINKMMTEMAKEGNILGMKMFIKYGADVSYDNDKPLKLASVNGYLDAVKYLVDRGADINNGRSRFTPPPLDYAVKSGDLNIVKYLVERGADVRANDDSALVVASDEGYLEIVKYLIDQGAVPSNIHLEYAAQFNHLDVVKYLIKNVNYSTRVIKDTVYIYGRENPEVVKYLVRVLEKRINR